MITPHFAASVLFLCLTACGDQTKSAEQAILTTDRPSAPVGSPVGTEAYRALREMALGYVPPEPPKNDTINGVVVDWGISEGVVVTTVALCDGSTSLYFSNGGGIIGAGGKVAVQTAAKSFLAEATRSRGRAVATSDLPLGTGDVRFHILGTAGRSMIAESWPPDISPDSDRGKLLRHWQDLITAIRQSEEPGAGG